MKRLVVVLGLVWAIGGGLWLAFYGICGTTTDAVAFVSPSSSAGGAMRVSSSPLPRVEKETCGLEIVAHFPDSDVRLSQFAEIALDP